MEEFSVEIKAKIEDFVSKMQDVGNAFKREKQQIEQDRVNILMDANTENLKEELKKAKKSLQDSIAYGDLTGDYSSVEHATNWVDEIQQKLQSLKPQVEDIKEDIQSGGTNGFSEWVSGATKVGLRLMGIRSVVFGVRRAIMGAVHDNKKLGNQFTAMSKMIQATLVPVLNWVASIVRKIMIALNSFLYGLTGVNYLAKAIKTAEKNAKGLNKQLASFDEINNLNKKNGGDNWWSGMGDEVKTYYDYFVQLGKKVREIYDSYIKPIWDKIKPVLSSIWSDYLKPLITSATSGFSNLAIMVGTITTAFGILTGNVALTGVGITTFAIGASGVLDGKVKKSVDSINTDVKDIKRNGKNSFGALASYGDTAFDEVYKSASGSCTDIQTKLDSLHFSNNYDKFWYNVYLNAKKWLDKIAYKLAHIWDNQDGQKTLVRDKDGNWVYKETGERISQYANGTNYVPNTQLALLHKGEAVIPSSYNQGSAYQPVGGDTADILVDIYNVIRNMKTGVTTDEIGRNAVKYINEQTMLTGKGVLV